MSALLALSAVAIAALSPTSFAKDPPPRTAPDRTALIRTQLFNDMFYGADDFFDENRDLPYSDSTRPSGRLVDTEADISRRLQQGADSLKAGNFTAAYEAYAGILGLERQYILAHANDLLRAGAEFLKAGDVASARALCDRVFQVDPANERAASLLTSVREIIEARLEEERRARAAREDHDFDQPDDDDTVTPPAPPEEPPVEPPEPPIPPDCPT